MAAVADRHADAIRTAADAEIARYLAAAQVAAGLGAQSDLSHGDFLAVTTPVVTDRLAGVTGIAYVVAADTAAVPSTQRYWRARGAVDLVLRPEQTTDRHYFAVLARSLTAVALRALGRDLAASSEAAAALEEARRTGTVTASRTYVLLSDRALPVEAQQRSFVVAAPVRAAASTPRSGQFLGWVMLGLRGGTFMTSVLRRASAGQVNVALADDSDPRSPVPVAQVRTGTPLDRPDLQRHAHLSVAHRSWQLTVTPTRALVAGDAQ
ncbi:CHASE domain-containing protein [Cryptosporangium sp. NPDC048952]|uniref:CHASE domain-containing protein n=1 Tax=Cryptosporangium sp. NPDC048952 TaxID=3363961 RepID=UPI003711C2BF